ncbi:efflux RND transporter permease subunit [Roseicitreum antarcticum]|uniref:Multidrug efflux pump n=1 Tax=Roseicitreum antarcticum TaxID=564137 RepID=A0A1H2W817_9RHOB|nr:efflux RND transporter permease subunit [Roseicitreum antarcticum]SDW76665.1 multidrug efflux pump [Roseicitreum antarcticum]
MNGIIDWAATHARMVIAFITVTLLAGAFAYTGLPKEGEPDIEIPALFISVPFPGISASDSESLLVEPMEQEMSGIDGLKTMSATASEGFAGLVLEFEFGWDKNSTIADVRDRMSRAEGKFPSGFQSYSIDEINFSQFPIIIVAISGDVPERTLLRAAQSLQGRIEGIEAVLEASIAGSRDEMLEVLIDPLRLEAYNVTAGELINVITRNNQLVAAGDIETDAGAFAVTVPATFSTPQDVYDLPIKVNGDSVVTLSDLAEIRLTFEDRQGTARFNGETTLAIQVVKRKGFNLIDTAATVRAAVEAERATWPPELQAAVRTTPALDNSFQVEGMVAQLEGSVLTAVALVMIVVLGALGTRSAMLVGFAVPTSFLLCFILLGLMGVAVSNIVMFGLILSVGMLVDGAVVVTEYADNRLAEGDGPMQAYTSAAKRMFWPVVASTGTTLCAFLPMLFWPGVAGEFMGMLPVTLIFVLSASLIVALVFLPVMGGVTGRIARSFARASTALRRLPLIVRLLLVVGALGALFAGAMQTLNPAYLLPPTLPLSGIYAFAPGLLIMTFAAMAASITLGSVARQSAPRSIRAGHRRSPIGWVMKLIVGNPIMPIVTVVAVVAFVIAVFGYFGENNRGVEFFVETEPEQGVVFVRARGNLSLSEKDALVRQAELVTLEQEGIEAVFSFAGRGGLNQNTAGAQSPLDTVGQIQFELSNWQKRIDAPDLTGSRIIEKLQADLSRLPGMKTEVLVQTGGPAGAKPVHLRLMGDNFDDLGAAVETVLTRFNQTPGLIDIEDTRPVPGIDWRINVDTAVAGRYGADVATVGGMVQLITRGILLDTMQVDTSDDEIEIRVRLPEEDRLLSTLDTLRVQTNAGLIPLSNFITREPVARRGQIDRVDERRYLDVKADVAPDLVKLVTPADEVRNVVPRRLTEVAAHAEGSVQRIAAQDIQTQVEQGALRIVPVNANERIEVLTQWLQAGDRLPSGIDWEWTGEQQDQEESTAFLSMAFAGALALMFLILLAQFNSFYNAALVLLAVVLSTAGVLIGMLVMDQTFSIIMTGTGIVALAGIVVNNNIVLIDTYQQYEKIMPRIEAIIRTVEARIRPVLMTTSTTMAGLTPMMFGLSIDFFGGGYSIDSPTALWWKQLATAVVFGLGIATFLTLLFTPALLALRVWVSAGAYRSALGLGWVFSGKGSAARRDRVLEKQARKLRGAEIIWDEPAPVAEADIAEPEFDLHPRATPLRAAE